MSTAHADPLPTALHTAAAVREMDRRSIEEHGIPGYTLMTRAGEASVAALLAHWPLATRISVVCGGGNNAGDGYVIARLLRASGRSVRVGTLAHPGRLAGDAAQAWRDAVAAGVPVNTFEAAQLDDAHVIVDAILGTGLERALTGDWAAAIDAVNAAHARGVAVLAVDIPSGLHADSGEVLGTAVTADLTVSFIGLKLGLFVGDGPGRSGAVVFADLGTPAAVRAAAPVAAERYTGADRGVLLAPRPRAAHKGDHGHVLVVGGDSGYAGAARMTGEAAARVGAGLVSVATRAAHAGAIAAARPELMIRGIEAPDELDPLLARASVLALGPGLGQQAWGRALFEYACGVAQPLVLDADALNLLAQTPRRRTDWVLTPHPGEAARLLGTTTAAIQTDRLGSARALVARYGGVVVLKGAGSVVAQADAPPALILAGNPGMGSGGMGDVLTGAIAGLLAQGLAPATAARLGAWLHATAGDLAAADGGQRGLLATDLLPHLRRLANP